MKGKCIGVQKGTSKKGNPYRIAYLTTEISSPYGIGLCSQSVFLPSDAPDPQIGHVYFVSFNQKGYCEDFIEVQK